MKRARPSEAAEYFSAASEIQNSIYQPLGTTLATNGANQTNNNNSKRSPSSTSSIPAFLTELLPTSSINSIQSKLLNKHISLSSTSINNNNTNKSGKTNNKKIFNNKKNKNVMNSKERKLNNLFTINDINKKELNYENYLPLNILWSQYINDLLTDSSLGSISITSRLIKADYHGAMITIVRSNLPSFISLSGIILQETAETFRIITKLNEFKIISKKGNVFLIYINDWRIELYGSQLRFRSSERAAKKFKSKPNIQLEK